MRYFVLLIMSATLISCNKGKEVTRVYGRALHKNTLAPIPNTEIRISSFDFPLSTYEPIIANTDVNGNYYLELVTKKDNGIALEAYNKDYIRVGSNIATDNNDETKILLPSGNVYKNKEFYFLPIAKFAGVFNFNLDKIDKNSAHVSISKFSNWRDNLRLENDGTVNPFPDGLKVAGDSFIRINIDFIKEGQFVTIQDSVYIKGFETFKDTLRYN
jgi:hypothetical protein